MKYSAIVLCAGNGTRTGLSYNKIFYTIGKQTIYEKTITTFLKDNNCQQIIVVTKENEIEDIKKLVIDCRIEYVIGGKERQDSVYEGLQKVNTSYVMIHDGARPYISNLQLEELLVTVEKYQACLLMVPCKDTIKEVIDGFVVRTIPRETLMQAQTPQVFFTPLIKEAYQKAKDTKFNATDDASIVEAFTNIKIKVVNGSYENSKITTKEDLL